MSNFTPNSFISQRYQKLNALKLYDQEYVAKSFILVRKDPPVVVPRKSREQVSTLKSVGANSGSFNFSKVTQKQWEGMHPCIQSKFRSYAVVDPSIQSHVDQCQKRVAGNKVEEVEKEELKLLTPSEIADVKKNFELRVSLQKQADELIKVCFNYRR